MKTATAAYIDLEEKQTRYPVELYRIWRGTTYLYYTSGDVAVVYDGHTYNPAAISRGQIDYNSDLEASSVDVTFSNVDAAISPYVAQAPIKLAWIEIRKLFRDQTPTPDTQVIFLGQIKSVQLTGIAAVAKCVGLEYLLQQQATKYYWQPGCNWLLGDARCGIDLDTYKVAAVVTVSADGLTLTASEFDAKADGYFTLGSAEHANGNALIINHVGANLTLQRAIPGITTGATVTAYPGCDGDVETCRDSFDNVDSFGGFPYVPIENPTTWIWK